MIEFEIPIESKLKSSPLMHVVMKIEQELKALEVKEKDVFVRDFSLNEQCMFEAHVSIDVNDDNHLDAAAKASLVQQIIMSDDFLKGVRIKKISEVQADYQGEEEGLHWFGVDFYFKFLGFSNE